MDFEELRIRAQRIAAPADSVAASGTPFESFVTKLRRKEEADRKLYKRLILAWISVGAVMFILAARQQSVGVGMIAAIYVFIAGLSWTKSRLLALVDYTGPTGQFLRDARKRYSFWGWKETLIAVPGLMILYFGGGLVVQGMAQKYFDPAGQATAHLVFTLFFVLVVVLGFIFTWSEWKKGNGKIVNEIEQMEQELMNG